MKGDPESDPMYWGLEVGDQFIRESDNALVVLKKYKKGNIPIVLMINNKLEKTSIGMLLTQLRFGSYRLLEPE